jgi:hypothetical protein
MFLLQISFQIGYGYFLEMKDTCCQCRIGLSIFENINKMLHGSSTAEAITGTGDFLPVASSIQWQTLFCSIVIH